MNAPIPRHPMQPLFVDGKGTLRFHENRIVRFLLDNGGYGLNELHRMSEAKAFSQDDWVQFSQLHGYSLKGFGELGFVPNEAYYAAAQSHEQGADQKDALIAAQQEEIDRLRGVLNQLKEFLDETTGF